MRGEFAQQGQNPCVGRWNLRGTGPDTDKVYWLEVTQKAINSRPFPQSVRACDAARLGTRRRQGAAYFRYGRGEGPAGKSGRRMRADYRATWRTAS